MSGNHTMTKWVEWFRYQLNATGEGFVWAFQQVEPILHRQLPPAPHYLGMWSPARLLWHVAEYERCVALPSMVQWLNDSMIADDAWQDTDEAWLGVQQRTDDEMISSFQAIHREQIQALDQLAQVDWTLPQETIWGAKPLAWVVTKTYQHRLEHSDTLLRMSMRWRDAEEAIARDAQRRSSVES